VEDNPLNQKLIGFMLKNWGFVFDLAKNGRLALDKLRVQKFDLVLMDVEMPELNGYETTQIIRTEMRSDVPVLALTAYSEEKDRQRCLEAGMSDCLSKPVDEKELEAKLLRYVNFT
jgi:CheY-like chemotaxis protein